TEPVSPAPETTPAVAAVPEKKMEEPAKPAPTEAAIPEKKMKEPTKPATPHPAMDAAPATEIQDVQISAVGSDKVDVLLIGDGAMNYDVFELSNPERLVIDVKSVSVVPGLGSRQSNAQQILSKVRVAQYQTTPKVVRA